MSSDVDVLNFVYQSVGKEPKSYSLSTWHESGRYIVGYEYGVMKTFRKDRVLDYLDGAYLLLQEPFYTSPDVSFLSVKNPSHGPEIIFTGFPAVQRAGLERRAEEAGMYVVKSVTKNLSYLCAGPTAGPTKIEKARHENVWILSQADFLELISTGVLPDATSDCF